MTNRIFKTFIGMAILFVILAINHLVREAYKDSHIKCANQQSEGCK